MSGGHACVGGSPFKGHRLRPDAAAAVASVLVGTG